MLQLLTVLVSTYFHVISYKFIKNGNQLLVWVQMEIYIFKSNVF